MKETENLKFSLSIGSPDETKEIKKTKFRISDSPNLNDVINFIKSRDITQHEKEKLIKIVNNVPHGALKNFKDNYKNYLRRK